MNFIVAFLVQLALVVVSELLRPKQKMSGPRAATLEEFTIPTATENRAIPIVWGQVRIAPNVVWLGDFQTRPVKKRIRTGLWSKDDLIIGHNYYVGMQMILCHGSIDTITGAWIGSRRVYDGDFTPPRPKQNQTNQLLLNISKAWTEPGEQAQSGVNATVEVVSNPAVWGNDDPNNTYASAYLDARLGANSNPRYSGYSYLVWRGPSHAADSGWVGTRAYAPPVTWGIRRFPDLSRFIPQENARWDFYTFNATPDNNLTVWNSFYAATKSIGGDANPAWCLAEILTSADFGAGFLGRALDQNSFCVAAQALYNEGCGISLKVESTQPVEKIVETLCRHVNGLLRIDPVTGRLAFKLLRAEDVSVMDLSPSNIAEMREFSRAGPDELINEVRIPFSDKTANYTKRYVIAQNPAATEFSNGQIVSTEVTFEGLVDASLAGVFAMRELRSLSSPLARASVEVNIQPGTWVQVGDIVRLSWPDHGISNMRMRVIKAAYKESLTSVSLDLLQDIFSAGTGFYSSTLTPPSDAILPPAPILEHGLILSPHALGSDGYEHALHYAIQPESTATTMYRLQWSPKIAFPEADTYDDKRTYVETCAKGALEFALPYSTDGAVVLYATATAAQLAAVARQPRSNIFAIIGDTEWVQIGSATVSSGKIQLTNISRGLFDTLPKAHASGTPIILLFDYSVDPMPLSSNYYAIEQVHARAGAVGPGGYAAFSAPASLVEDPNNPRAFRRLPPANVRINGLVGGLTEDSSTLVPTGGDPMTLTYAARNREDRRALSYFDETSSIEPNTKIYYGISYRNPTPMGDLEWSPVYEAEVVDAGEPINITASRQNQPIRVTLWADVVNPTTNFVTRSLPQTFYFTAL